MDRAINRAYIGDHHIISSLGYGTAQNVEALLSFTTNLSEYDRTPVCRIDREALEQSLESLDGYTFGEQIAILSMTEVAERSRVAINAERTAIILSTTKGNVELLNSNFERTYLCSFADRIKGYFNCEKSPTIVTTACISGVAAIVIAARMVEDGEADSVYVVGVDVVSEFIVAGFNSFKSISPTVCRPYDLSRDGLTLGEGCGVLLITSDRTKSPSGIVVSGGDLSSDANHISGPSRSGDGLAFAIDKAINEAGIKAADVGYINMHGTATIYNDEMESKAANLSGLCSTPCNSLKPYIGHTLGASGVIETIFVVEQMRRGVVFGVKGYQESGVPYPLNVSAQHRECQINHAVKSASGFGGTNGAIVLSREEALAKSDKSWPSGGVEVEMVAQVEITQSEELPFADFIKGEYRELKDANLKFFKMDSLSKLGYVASCQLMSGVNLDVSSDRISVILANSSSSLESDLKHQAVVNQHLSEGASPAIFVYTLPNIVAAEIAIKHKFQGESLFVIEAEKSMRWVESYAKRLLERDICDAVVYGWCELLGENYNAELKLITKKL